MASISFAERFQASYVFPLDHNTLMTMIMIVVSLVGTKPVFHDTELRIVLTGVSENATLPPKTL